ALIVCLARRHCSPHPLRYAPHMVVGEQVAGGAVQHSLLGYAYQMGLRPQTLYGIADSPVGLAAYLLDHDARSYELIARAFAGQSEGLTRDDILDNITVTWLTNTAISGARLYWENKGASFFAVKGVAVPV